MKMSRSSELLALEVAVTVSMFERFVQDSRFTTRQQLARSVTRPFSLSALHNHHPPPAPALLLISHAARHVRVSSNYWRPIGIGFSIFLFIYLLYRAAVETTKYAAAAGPPAPPPRRSPSPLLVGLNVPDAFSRRCQTLAMRPACVFA